MCGDDVDKLDENVTVAEVIDGDVACKIFDEVVDTSDVEDDYICGQLPLLVMLL